MRRVARCQGCHERGRQLRRPYIFSEIQVLLPSKGKGHDWTNDDGIGKRFPRRVEHAFDVTIQRSHHTYSGEHRWPVMFCKEEELARGPGSTRRASKSHSTWSNFCTRPQRC